MRGTHIPYLVGVLLAWAVAQVATGVFFLLAYWFGRRERESALFGALALCFAVTTANMALAYGTTELGEWGRYSQLAHVGLVVAAAVNLDFVLTLTGGSRRYIGLAYAAMVIYLLVLLSGYWWQPGSERYIEAMPFGFDLPLVVVKPRMVSSSFYLVAIAELVFAELLFLRAYRRGRSELLFAVVGGGGLCAAGVHDPAIQLGLLTQSTYLLPHACLLYGFCIASLLLVRYGRAAVELVAASDHLRETTAQLRHSNAELRQMQNELSRREQLAAVGELAATIAHEVRNPLAVIMNAVASIRRERSTAEDRAMLLGIVEEETARLNNLVGDLLRYARPLRIQKTWLELRETLESAQLSLSPKHELKVVGAEELSVEADPTLLKTVFENLVENAVQAMPDGGCVVVEFEVEQIEELAMVRISISDSGAGMSEVTLARATDPFFTTRPRGTGLGLPIVQRVIDAHGGRFELTSREGQGTQALIFLPQTKSNSETHNSSDH